MNDFKEYTNYDGINVQTNCGEAAIATYLVNTGKLAPSETVVKDIEHAYPPNVMFGYFGTNKDQIKKACKSKGVVLKEKVGQIGLLTDLAAGKLCILLIGWFDKSSFPYLFGHWTVAYKYDAENQIVSLSNYGDIKVAEIPGLWSGFVPILGGMNSSYLTE